MKRSPLCPAALLIAGTLACGGSPDAPVTDPTGVERAASSITTTSLSAHVNYLASDAMRGRATPSPELGAAAAYIAQRFQALRLDPAGDAGSFLQHYPCAGVATADLPANVVATMRGSDAVLADEWVVVSAHYDHAGVGTPVLGDSIYNGADDNASGTAGLLEVAHAFAALSKAPARSVAFVAVSGEELGLVGSAYFVQHRPAAIGVMVADVNLDMIGRNQPDLLYLIGDTLSSIGATALGLLTKHPDLALHRYSRNDLSYRFSDQLSFALAGVPAIFFNTGVHADLHRVSDEVERLNVEKASRVARLAFYLAYELAASPTRPTWTPAGERVIPTLQPFNGTCPASTP